MTCKASCWQGAGAWLLCVAGLWAAGCTSPEERAQRAVDAAVAKSHEASLAAALAQTTTALEPLAPAGAIVRLTRTTVSFDDALVVQQWSPLQKLRRIESSRPVGTRVTTSLRAEVSALSADAQGLAAVTAKGERIWSAPNVALEVAPDVTVLALLKASDEVRAGKPGRIELVLRGAEGPGVLVPELRGDGWVEPETCAHAPPPSTSTACALPEVLVRRTGACVTLQHGDVGSECLPGQVVRGLGALYGRDAGPDAPEPECVTAPTLAALLSKVDALVQREPGCKRSRVKAVGDVTWGEVAPVIASLTSKGLWPALEWEP